MKITIKQVAKGEEEIIIHYQEMTPEINQLISFIKKEKSRIIGWLNKSKWC